MCNSAISISISTNGHVYAIGSDILFIVSDESYFHIICSTQLQLLVAQLFLVFTRIYFVVSFLKFVWCWALAYIFFHPSLNVFFEWQFCGWEKGSGRRKFRKEGDFHNASLQLRTITVWKTHYRPEILWNYLFSNRDSGWPRHFPTNHNHWFGYKHSARASMQSLI